MTVAVEIDDRIAKCQKILNQDPNSQIFAALAEAYRKKGSLDKAFRVCQSGLKIHPSYGSAHVVMAKINLDRRLYDWAEVELKKAVEIDGNSRAIELLLAEIYIYKGEFNSAVKLLKRLTQSDPDSTQIKKLLDIALRLPEEQAQTVADQAEVTIATVSTGENAAAAESATGPSGLQASDVLQQALTLPDLDGALFMNSEGLVVDSQWRSDIDLTVCGATFTELGRLLNQELVKASFGRGKTVLIESSGPVFYLVQAEGGMFLFLGSTKTNLGRLRMKISELVDNCRDI